MRLPGLRRVFGRIRHAGFIALVVIGLAFILYGAPYAVDAAQCLGSLEQPAAQQAGGADEPAPSFWQCLEETYDRARQDTNLAAIIIAMAITLAAGRPGQDDP